jgi:hypothetical protein
MVSLELPFELGILGWLVPPRITTNLLGIVIDHHNAIKSKSHEGIGSCKTWNESI